MKTYQMVDLWYDGYFLYLIISHEAVAQEILKGARDKVSGAQLKVMDDLWRFEHTQGKERVLYYWLIGWLGDAGFEPYATSLHGQVSGYCFRRGSDKQNTPRPASISSTSPFIR